MKNFQEFVKEESAPKKKPWTMKPFKSKHKDNKAVVGKKDKSSSDYDSEKKDNLYVPK